MDASLQGYQVFAVNDATTDHLGGTFIADESAATDLFGNTNEELVVTSTAGTTGTVGTAAGDVPPVGSVFDYYSLGGDSGYANIYSDLASTTSGGNVISDTLVTPFGDINIPIAFDAAAGLPAALADAFQDLPEGANPTAVSGLPPLDVAMQYQLTGLHDTPLGAVGGPFDGDVTTTSDAFGFTTDELLVTSTAGATGTVGTTTGDVPPVGSVFNTISFGDGLENEYSAIPSTGGGDVVTDTLVTPFGSVDVPVVFDAAAVADANAAGIPLSGGETIVPVAGTEALTGVNGVPPLDVAIQGTQTFDVNGLADTPTLDADVSTASVLIGDTDEAIRVVSATSADAPQAGSVFDINTLGDSGFANVYSDIVSSAGANTFADTFVTPLGDFTRPAD